MLTLQKIGGGCYRAYLQGGKQSMFTRYGILKDSLSKDYSDATAEVAEDGVLFHGVKRDLAVSVEQFGDKGFQIKIPLI